MSFLMPYHHPICCTSAILCRAGNCRKPYIHPSGLHDPGRRRAAFRTLILISAMSDTFPRKEQQATPQRAAVRKDNMHPYTEKQTRTDRETYAGKTQRASLQEERQERPEIVLCDSEATYGERLMEYLQSHLPFPFDIELYTSRESLLEKGDFGRAALVVISEREYRKGGIEGELLVLNETEQYIEGTANVSKYQSMDGILEVIRQMVLRDEKAVPGMLRHGRPMRLIGFYTPLTRCLQTTAALTVGEFLSQRHKTLYLNLEAYSGMERLLGQSFHGSAADLLYYNECAREKLPAQLGLLTCRLGGLDYIPPMKSFLELRGAQARKWISLFRSMEQMTEYEFLLLDLSESVDGLFEMLRACEQIITIVREDAVSAAKIGDYERLLREMGCADIAARKWQFRKFDELPAAMDNLTHGEMAECVQELMEEAGYGADENRRGRRE